MVMVAESIRQSVLETLVRQHCGETLEVLYYVTPACSRGSDRGEEACVCRVTASRGAGTSGRVDAPTTANVILRLHRGASLSGSCGTSAVEVQGSGGEAKLEGDSLAGGENGESSTKLWDFLEELRVGNAGGDLIELDDDGGSGKSTFRAREVEYLPFTDASIRDVLRGYEKATFESFNRGAGRGAAHDEEKPSYYLHPNILTPMAFFSAGSSVLSIYPSAGKNLSSVLKYSTKGFLSTATLSLVVYQIAQLVKFCHNSGVTFGDLSASKLFMNDDALIFALVDYHKIVKPAGGKGDVGVGQGGQGAASDEEATGSFDSTEVVQSLSQAFVAWREGALSNFDYLMKLNAACGRERGNLAFYPVLPWVITMASDPSSEGSCETGLDRNDDRDGTSKGRGEGEEGGSGAWRDLSKTKWRLAKGDLQLDMTYISSDPPHHVSDEALSELTICVYLARRLQKKVLTDVVRAVFEPREYPSSMARMYSWTPDEAIPDFYDNPEIFSSIHREMADLQVPGWASSPEEFVRKHRAALESPRVSEVLHHWIDLNFGYAMYGEAAIRNKNVHLPHRDTCFPRNRGRYQMFTESHPPRFPSPRKELAFNLVINQERVQRFVASQFSFCKKQGSEHQESRLSDIFFLCQAAFALFSTRKRDILHADAGYCCGGKKDIGVSEVTEHLFPHSLQKYVSGLLSTSAAFAMDQVILCPSFESHTKDVYDLMTYVNDPSIDLHSKLKLTQKALRRVQFAGSVDRGVYVIIFRVVLNMLHLPDGGFALEPSEKERPSEEMGRDLMTILEVLLRELPKATSSGFLIPFVVNAFQGAAPTHNLSGKRHLGLNLSELLLKPSFIRRLLHVLGANTFFKSIFPKILEFVTQKMETRSVQLVSDVLISLVDYVPLPVTVKQVLDPILNLLYYDACFMQLALNVSKHLGGSFIRFQLYPRLVEIVKKVVLATGKSQRARRQRMFRPTTQISEHLSYSLVLLQCILEEIEPSVIMKTLIEDTLHKDIQQPSILFQMLLLPYPDLSVLSNTARLLVEGSKVGGGIEYMQETLLPNLEPIFYVSEDSTPEYVTSISYLYKLLCREIGEEGVRLATREWPSTDSVRAQDTASVELSMKAVLLSNYEEARPPWAGEGLRKKKLSYGWLRKSQDRPVLPFNPLMPEGIKIAPESYMTSLDDKFEQGFKCIHQFKPSVSKVRFMVGEEMGQLVLAAGSASSSSSSPVIRAWNFEEETVERIYVNHTSTISGMSSLWNGKVVASCEVSGLLHIWEPHTEAEMVYNYGDAGERASDVVREGGCTCMATHEECIIMGTGAGTLVSFDANAQRPYGSWRATPHAENGSIQCVASDHAGQLCAGFSNGRASLLDPRSGEVTCHFEAMQGGAPIQCLRFVDPHLLCAGGRDAIKIFDIRKVSEGFRTATSRKGGAPTGIYPVGRKVLVSWGPRLQVVDPTSPEPEFNPKPFKLKNRNGVKENSTISGVSLLGLSHSIIVGNENAILFYSVN